MVKFLSNTRLFYASLLLLSLILFFTGALTSPREFDLPFFVSAPILVLIILIVEKIITGVFKALPVEIRSILSLFLFLSPVMQLNLFLSYNRFFSIFFLVFAFFNYTQYEKEQQKIFFLFSFLGLILSVYFYSYTLAATIPLLIFVILKSGWKGIIYFSVFIAFLYFFFRSETFSSELYNQWKLSNLLKSDFDLISYQTVNIIFAFFPLFHPLVFIAGIIVLPFIRFEDFEEPVIKISALSFIIFALFIAGLTVQYFSMLTITFPLLIIILFPAIMRVIYLTVYFRPRFTRILPFIVLIIQLSLLGFLLISNEQMYFK